jgi:hypothetical protein
VPGAGNPQAYDRYVYANNNPIIYIDPTGHIACIDGEQCFNRRSPVVYFSSSASGKGNKPIVALINNGNAGIESNSENNSTGKDDDIPLPTSQQFTENVAQQDPANPPPSNQRLTTIIFVVPSFLIVDVVLAGITKANTFVLMTNPEPVTKGIFVLTEIIIIGVDIVVAFAHVSYTHWVTTGRFIKSVDDLTNWEYSP